MPYDDPLGSLDKDDIEWLNTIESLISLPEEDSIFSSLAKATSQLIHSDHFAVMHIPRGGRVGTILYSLNSFETGTTHLSFADCEDFKEPSLDFDPIYTQYTQGSAVLRQVGDLFGILEPKSVVLCPASEDQDNGVFVLSFVRETVEFSEHDGGTQVTFVHEGVPGAAAREEHEKGWNNTFDMLDGVLRED